METATRWELTTGPNATLNCTYADSTITNNPYDTASVGKQFAGVPRNEFIGRLSYASGRGWRAAIDARRLSESYGDNDHSLRQGPFFVLDISAHYAITKELDAFVQLQNFLDRQYIANNDGAGPPVRYTT